uniref:PiggyBac transposable element-derived protein 3-like n=1 Tax=Hirondellea gigas TaxID=1518452 RepID=A0A6A7GCV3_9CRUS
MYDFIPYIGKINPVEDPNISDLQASSNIVLYLAQNIPSHKNHLLFFDNWFTGVPLIDHLASRGIWCCGTVRDPSLPGISKEKKTDKALVKKGRGSYEKLVCQDTDHKLYYVKWCDNRIVNIVSLSTRASPITKVERYDSKQKKVIEVSCPDIIYRYNRSMGAVELTDCLIALYRINLRSKKYYLRLVFHIIDMAIVNSWLLYRKDAKNLKLQKKDIMPLFQFKLAISNALIKKGKAQKVKRCRPSAVSQGKPPKHPRSLPEDIICFNQVNNFPVLVEKRN